MLLVDDDEGLRALGKRILDRAGYGVVLADSGEQALERWRADKEHIDLIILDISMPGMGGHRCLELLLAEDPEVRVIISSGYSRDGRLKDTLALGAAGFIAKPYRQAEFLTAVRAVLDQA